MGGIDMASIYAVAKQTWQGGQKITLAEAAAVPYASMAVSLGGSSQIMLILASDEGGQQLWTSGSGIAISTREGRIIRTAGFGYDLGGDQAQSESVNQNNAPITRWRADFPDLGLYSVLIACRTIPRGDATITILGKDIQTRLTEEQCRSESDELKWSFKNKFWTDPADGLMWRSIQHVHPKLDAVELEILRPPG